MEQWDRSTPMRYVLLAAAAVLVTVSWLNTAGGQRAKQHMLAPGNGDTWFTPTQ